MDRDRFVVLAFAAFGCVLAAFVTLGFSRLVVGYRTGQVLAAPFGLVGFALVCYLTVLSAWRFLSERSVVGTTGVVDGEDDGE